MNKNIIIEGNTIYELDPECLKAESRKKKKKRKSGMDRSMREKNEKS